MSRGWHGDRVTALAVTTDGQLLSGSDDTTASLWCHGLLVPSSTFHHGRPVSAIAVSPDDALIATASRSRVVVWESRSGQPVVELAPYGSVTCVGFNPEGRGVLVGGEAGLGLWALDGTQIAKVHDLNTAGAANTPDGLWSAQTTSLNFLPKQGGWDTVYKTYSLKVTIGGASFADDGRRYALHAGGTDVVVGDRSLPTSQVKDSVGGLRHTVEAVAIAPDGWMVAVGFSDGLVEVRTFDGSASLAAMPHPRPVRCLAFSRTGDELSWGPRTE